MPQPVTTPSPGMRFLSAPKSVLRCSTNMSNSSKRIRVEEEIDALARRELAASVLRRDSGFFAAAQPRALAPFFELLENVLHGNIPATDRRKEQDTSRAQRVKGAQDAGTARWPPSSSARRFARASASASVPHASLWNASSRRESAKASGRVEPALDQCQRKGTSEASDRRRTLHRREHEIVVARCEVASPSAEILSAG